MAQYEIAGLGLGACHWGSGSRELLLKILRQSYHNQKIMLPSYARIMIDQLYESSLTATWAWG